MNNDVEIAEKIGRLDERIKTLEKTLDKNFEQHDEFFQFKKYISFLDTANNRIDSLENALEDIRGFAKGAAWVFGLLIGAISIIISILAIG